MKKNTLFILCLTLSFFGFSQTAQNFATSGQDSAPTVLTINSGDITVNGGDPITAISIGTFTSNYNSPTGSSTQCGNWYDFILNVTGGAADGTSVQGCDADFNGIDVTGFTRITLTSNDLDGTDTVFFDVDLLVTFTVSSPPSCDATLTQTTNVPTSGDISWTAATGALDNYNVTVGTTSGGNDIYDVQLGDVLTTNIGTLTGGTTYYVNIVPSNSAGPATGCTEQTFTTFQGVVNDTQATAIPITPAAEGTGCSLAQFTLAFDLDGTTDSGVDGSCNGASTGLDQWFTWTATSDGLLFLDTAPGNPGIVVRDTSGNEIDCAQTFTSSATSGAGDVLSGWAIGQDLIIQIYDFGTSVSTVAFCLEEYTLPAAPNCATDPDPADGAIDIPTGNVTFTWSAPATGPTPTAYELYAGETTSLEYGLIGTFTTTTADLTINANSLLLYWQVVPLNGESPAAGCPIWEFTTEDPPPAPANDLPGGAITLTLDEGSACGANTITGISNEGTTDSAGAAVPSCGSYGTPTDRGDLWYVFTAPDTTVTLNTTNLAGFTSIAGTYYTGTPGSLVEAGCTAFSSGWPWELTGLNIGETYYLRVWDYNNDQFGTFDLCGYYVSCTPGEATAQVTTNCATTGDAFGVSVTFSAENDATGISDGTTTYPISGGVAVAGPYPLGSPAVTISIVHSNSACNFDLGTYQVNTCPPANDACSSATVVDTLPFTSSADASTATNNDGFVDCGFAGMNDGVWYTFTPTASGTLDLSVDVTGWDPEIAVYTGSCGVFTCVDNADNGATGAPESLSISVTAGTQYWLNIGQWSSSSDNSEGAYTFNATSSDGVSLGLEDMEISQFTYYPNPVNNILTLDAQKNIESVVAYNMLGQEVLRLSPNTVNTEVDMSSLVSGAYFVKVSIQGATKTVRIIKQ